jgi:hypothetical protein
MSIKLYIGNPTNQTQTLLIPKNDQVGHLPIAPRSEELIGSFSRDVIDRIIALNQQYGLTEAGTVGENQTPPLLWRTEE